VGEINVRRREYGPIVRTIRSDASGRFVVQLEPGPYVLDWIPDDGPWPLLKPVHVIVPARGYTDIQVRFGSGVR
jgi:hypothetical protein